VNVQIDIAAMHEEIPTCRTAKEQRDEGYGGSEFALVVQCVWGFRAEVENPGQGSDAM
jgi:hypothetical protein